LYTDKDLKAVPPPPSDAATAPDAAADPNATPPAEGEAPKDAAQTDKTGDAATKAADDKAGGADAKPAEAAKDQAYWAGRAKDLQTQLERDKSYADALQARINALTTNFANR